MMNNNIQQPKMPRKHIFVADYIFYLMILTFPFEDSITIAEMSIPKIIGILFIIVATVNWRRYFGAFPKAVTAYLLVIIIGLCSDIPILKYIDMSILNEIIRPLLVFITFYVAYNLGINGQNKKMMYILAFTSTLFALLSVLGFGKEMGANPDVEDIVKVGGEIFERSTAFGSNPNGAARIISLSILCGSMVFFGIVKTKKVYRYLWGGAAFVGFMALIQTASRGGVAGLLMGLLASIFNSKKLTGKIFSFIVVGMIILAGNYTLLNDRLFTYRVEQERESRTFGGRTVLWEAAFEVFKEAPIFGNGHFLHAYMIGAKVGKESRSAHNTFLSVLAATGVTGFVCYLAFWFYTLKAAWKIRQDDIGKVLFPWLVMGVVGALMMGMQNTKWLVVVMALTLSQNQIWLADCRRRN